MRVLLALLLLLPQILRASANDPQTTQREGTGAWAALVKPGQEAALAATVGKFGEAERAALAAHDIGRLEFFTESLGERCCVVAIQTLLPGAKADADWAGTLRADAKSRPWLEALEASIDPHPRLVVAGDAGRLWVRAETICQLRPEMLPGTHADLTTHAAITGLKPEKEADYRNLHSHVWPGVIDAIGASAIPRFDLYLIEFGDALYLIYSFDYRGTDFDGDMAKMAANPVNKRWWKFTDACQSPLPNAKGIWEPMEPAVELPPASSK